MLISRFSSAAATVPRISWGTALASATFSAFAPASGSPSPCAAIVATSSLVACPLGRKVASGNPLMTPLLKNSESDVGLDLVVWVATIS